MWSDSRIRLRKQILYKPFLKLLNISMWNDRLTMINRVWWLKCPWLRGRWLYWIEIKTFKNPLASKPLKQLSQSLRLSWSAPDDKSLISNISLVKWCQRKWYLMLPLPLQPMLQPLIVKRAWSATSPNLLPMYAKAVLAVCKAPRGSQCGPCKLESAIW